MIVDVLRLYDKWGLDGVVVRPGRNGDEAWACCPLHGEARPSFSVNMQNGKWHCLSCHASGSSIESLIRKMEGLDTDAQVADFIRVSAHKSVDEIRRDLRAEILERKSRSRRRSIDHTRTDEHLLYSKKQHKYLVKRGFDPEVIRVHQIGYDAQAQSITIPVIEHGICRFMYRRTVINRKPPYLYPTDIDKASYLWGLDRPTTDYHGSTIYVTEGALDALWLRQHGHPHATAILGSHMSMAQARKIASLEPECIILFFDNDEAGYDATETAGGLLIRHGIRHVFYVRYLASSDGTDPQSCTPDEIRKMIRRKKHYHHFKLASKVGRRTRIRRLLAKAKAR